MKMRSTMHAIINNILFPAAAAQKNNNNNINASTPKNFTWKDREAVKIFAQGANLEIPKYKPFSIAYFDLDSTLSKEFQTKHNFCVYVLATQ